MIKQQIKLRPCHRCGEQPHKTTMIDGLFMIQCPKPLGNGVHMLVYGYTMAEAIEDWNDKNDPVRLAKIQKRIHKRNADDAGHV